MTEEEKFYTRMNHVYDEVVDMWDLVGRIGMWVVGIAFGLGTLLVIALIIVNKAGITP